MDTEGVVIREVLGLSPAVKDSCLALDIFSKALLCCLLGHPWSLDHYLASVDLVEDGLVASLMSDKPIDEILPIVPFCWCGR